MDHRTEYDYSGDGFLAMIRKFEDSSLVDEIRIVRDGFLAIQDREADNTVLREYTWGLNLGGGISGLIDLEQNGQNYAYLYDGKGNVIAVLDNSEAVVATYQYDPFGILLAQTGSLTQPFGFSTKRYDAQTGLIHYQYRPYAPAIGRWLTRDPLGEAGGLNLYEFVGNNPVNWVDPWGLKSVAEERKDIYIGCIAAVAACTVGASDGGLSCMATWAWCGSEINEWKSACREEKLDKWEDAFRRCVNSGIPAGFCFELWRKELQIKPEDMYFKYYK